MINIRRVLSKNKTISRTAARFFSSGQGGPGTQGYGRTASLALLGGGTAGLSYMLWKSMEANRAVSPAMPMHQDRMTTSTYVRPQATIHNPIVQSRVQNALAYFGCGLGLTGLSVALFRYTSLAHMHPLMLFIPTIAAMIGTQYLDYHTQGPIKHVTWGAFCGLEGLLMSPLINMAGMPLVYNALAATGVMMGLLGYYAYSTPTNDFLSWRGGLTVGLCGLIGTSLVNMFWPSPLMSNLIVYGGLMLFGGFVLYDTQKLLQNAMTMNQWDPINESIKIYLDAIIIFQKFLFIFMSNKRKR